MAMSTPGADIEIEKGGGGGGVLLSMHFAHGQNYRLATPILINHTHF